MKVGVTIWFQNMADLQERAMNGDMSQPMPRSDFDCLQDDFALCDLVEPLGFDKLWTIEHHCSPYGMTVTPTQIFSYMAGRTSRIGFGSMVMVLPWNDPIRLAGEISMLDNMLAGRELSIGVGRGAAPQEFAAFRTDYSESRERMVEVLEILRLALSREHFSYDGEHYKIPETSIRPQPHTTDLTRNMLMAWSSPETRQLAAESGCAPLFNNFSNWDGVRESTDEFNAVRRANGWEEVSPTVAGPVFVSHDKEKVAQAREWVKMTFDTSIWHYGLFNQPSFRKLLEGKTGAEAEATIEAIRSSALNVGAFGTPEEVLEQLSTAHEATGFGELICQMSYGMMPREWATDSMTLFSEEVLPSLKAMDTKSTNAAPFSDVEASRLKVAAPAGA